MPLRPAFLFACCLALTSSTSAYAASVDPTVVPSVPVEGMVLDASRAPIAGAEILATTGTGAVAGKSVSSERGEFRLALRPGRYTVTGLAPGFDAASSSIEVTPAGLDPIVLELPVASVHETVNVSAPPGGYEAAAVTAATKTITPLRDVPQSITVVTRQLMQDQLMLSVADVVRYVPGITAHQGENNRDQVIIRGNNSSADFFVNGVRDDVQYYRDLYNLERVEALKGPNAMIFGRGGGGGVINRVTKDAGFAPVRDLTFVGGSFGRKRVASDLGGPIGGRAALRVNAMYEDAGSFRDGVSLRRYGVNPTMTLRTGSRSTLTLGFEHFNDRRTADRGIPSFGGRPLDVDVSTYFGNASDTYVRARADILSAAFEQRMGRLTLRDRVHVADYGRGYQNFVPGATTADARSVTLTAYNNRTERLNVFNQTDLTAAVATGAVRHTLLAGAEVGRQLTDNFRNTGYFGNTAGSVTVPVADRPVLPAVVFRQSATDADNHVRTAVAAVYAQDQVELSRVVQLIGGLRADSFDLRFHNNRTGADLARTDVLVSPRAGVVVKPIVPLSLYGSYTVSYLPGSGDQFSSLTAITEQLKPERFANYEAGVKWDVAPSLAFTTAAYRLDRTNTRSIDPLDATRIVQTGSQRTNGLEVALAGRVTRRWQVAGGYAWQDAFVTSATAAARAGARVAQVPRHTLSLWNMCQVRPRVSVAAGIVRRTDMFAAIDDSVVLPGYTTLDAATYVSLSGRARLQVNAENVLNRRYFANADNNTNISPGSPRAFRIALATKF